MIKRGMKVKWLSLYKDGHWFTGKVLRVYLDGPQQVAVVDDGSGLSLLVIHTWRLMEVIK